MNASHQRFNHSETTILNVPIIPQFVTVSGTMNCNVGNSCPVSVASCAPSYTCSLPLNTNSTRDCDYLGHPHHRHHHHYYLLYHHHCHRG
jgi:hypothetical protein